ncbi:hypothetical protein APHAL10511_003285 [Amanita phalloides]|nr:hypothetical protein APHAL10511_003285 [Amanita phalloides]
MLAVGPSVGEIPLMINVGSIFASFVQSLVQAIYAQRIYRLSRSLFIPIACWIVILYNLCAGITYSMVVANKSPEEFLLLERKLHWLLVTWYSAMGIVDMVITVTLCCILLRLRRSSRCNSQRAMNILDTVVLWTIQTGMVTSLLAVAVVVVYCSVSPPGAWIALTLGITSAYALSLVTLLNGRSLLLNHPSNQGDATVLATLTVPGFSVATDSCESQVTGDQKDGLV